jgi:predicted dinucleotide-binding enzyme
MRIWIIGSDPVARALARSWTQAGHEVLFTFSFDGIDWDALTAETGGRYATLAEGATAEVMLLALPWAAVAKVLRTAGSLAGKVVLDATNPHEPVLGASGAEEVAAGLIVDAGFVPVDAGRLDAARDVEALGRLLVDIAYRRGPGPVGYQLLTTAELSAAGGLMGCSLRL